MNPTARPRDTVGDAALGAVLGERYRLDARIGAGGMATIYRAHDLVLDRDVAVKILHGHLGDDETVLARFRTEARHAAALTHPHIVNVYDQGVADLPYIVMELVSGPSLRDLLTTRGQLRPEEALSVIGPICQAMDRAHAAGVVHRDIKPENVLISADGITKVADFGIARALESTNFTQTGTLIGSVHYLAPELVDGADATPASDQYAVGVLFFELLTGQKPLPAETPMKVALRHATEPIPPASQFNADVDPELDEVLTRATAQEPEDRFPTMGAFAVAAAQAVHAAPEAIEITTVDPNLIDGQTRIVVEPDEATFTDTMSETLPPHGMYYQEASPVSDDDVTQVPPPPDQRDGGIRRWPILVALVLVLVLGLSAAAYAAWDQVIAPVQTLPNLDGMTEEEATGELATIGFSLEIRGEENRLDVPEGEVFDQHPPPGTEERRGGTVQASLSLGPETVTMPDVLGLPGEEAIELLEEEPYFFTVTEGERQPSSSFDEGQVIGTSPDVDAELRQGTSVQIAVSDGPAEVQVPNLVEMSAEEAENLLNDLELNLDENIGHEWSDDYPEQGTVIRQSPEPSTGEDDTVEVDTTVEIAVSRGPLTIPVPEVLGEDAQNAIDTLEGSGLNVELDRNPLRPLDEVLGIEPYIVRQQSPGDGTVERGDTVTIRYYVVEEEAEDIEGEDENDEDDGNGEGDDGEGDNGQDDAEGDDPGADAAG